MKQKEFGKEWQDEQREKMVRFQFPETIKRIEDKAREEGKQEGYKNGWKDNQTLIGLRESEKDTYFDDEDIDELINLEKIEESI